MISSGLKEVSCGGSSNEYPSPVSTLPRRLTVSPDTLKVIFVTLNSPYRLFKLYFSKEKKLRHANK
jgi:hypothetical protein